ncbi:ATP-binding protein [Calothrix sp. FACHB-1219]|uniref:AAA family ATPase n=1 Tax=unclassified Calothrix TaxID=2619626 RepID=UPI0016853605|nr:MULTISPECIES: AAA family ATPase [unclassified Calothrix]MBD2208026.1 ATP-binding protein [Calothrix sp. FACHB-168]MBD2222230.1 ATP-binding protein [Calothrix sp. FACHB-1219]
MNSPPKPPTTINSRGHPTEFEQIIQAKSHNFIGREFVFTAIHEFIHRYRRGYFTITGAPGSGKSAILAKYATDNPHVVYYNVEVEGKNRAEEFIKVVCNELVEWLRSSSTPPQPSPQARREQDLSNLPPFTGGLRGVGDKRSSSTPPQPSPQARREQDLEAQVTSESNLPPFTGGLRGVPDHATEGSWFLSLLLQQISDELAPEQKLIITIDGLDRIDRSNQSPGTNLFYLPRYLPDKVYFLLTRRPFLKEKSGLLIETPFQTLDLAEYPVENQQDIQRYIQQFTLRLRSGLNHEDIQAWLNYQQINEQELCNILATKSANNFMYISQVLTAMAEGFDAESFDLNQLPTGLETYYQQHWQQMKAVNQDEELSQAVLNVLVKQQQPLSVAAIAELINADEFDIEEVLESWFEFLIQEDIAGEEYYSFYHENFREWLANKV